MRADRPELLAELVETCRRTIRELDEVADEPDISALRADIVEVAHQAEYALEAVRSAAEPGAGRGSFRIRAGVENG